MIEYLVLNPPPWASKKRSMGMARRRKRRSARRRANGRFAKAGSKTRRRRRRNPGKLKVGTAKRGGGLGQHFGAKLPKNKKQRRQAAGRKAARTRAANKKKKQAAARKAARTRARGGKKKGKKHVAKKKGKKKGSRRRRKASRFKTVYVRRSRGKKKGTLRAAARRRAVYARRRHGKHKGKLRRINPGRSAGGLLGRLKSAGRALSRPGSYVDALQILGGLSGSLAAPVIAGQYFPVIARYNSGYTGVAVQAASAAVLTAVAGMGGAKLAGNVLAGGMIATLARAVAMIPPVAQYLLGPLQLIQQGSMPMRPATAGRAGGAKGMGLMTADQLAYAEGRSRLSDYMSLSGGMGGMGEYLTLPGGGAEFAPSVISGESF